MPLAIVFAMLAATVIYMAIAVTAVSVMHWSELAGTEGLALVAVVEKAAPWLPPVLFTAISIFAVSNTALVNWIMGSRLLYGMSKQGLMPAALGRVHPTRRTPHVAILTLLVVVAALAMIGDIKELASATVLLLLSVFTVVNIALVVLKRRPTEKAGGFEVPIVVPILGAAVCAALILVRLGQGSWTAPAIAIGLLLAIAALYFITGAGRDQTRLQRFIEQDEAAAQA